MKTIEIKTKKGIKKIGQDNPCFIIAEMSANHNHDIEKAKRIINSAVECGVDAIKLQTYTPDTMTINSDKEDFKVKVNDNWSGQSLYDLYKKAYTPWEWHEELKQYAESKGLVFFSTPFDKTAVDFLEKLDVKLYKVASFETSHIPLLKKIGETKKPVIISRGLTNEEDLKLAIDTLRNSGCPQVVVLHCVSSYPANVNQMNLKVIPDIQNKFNVLSGLSDHSISSIPPIVAVALGANVIEKHFTLSREDGGVDAEFSLEPYEMEKLVEDIRNVENAMGEITYEVGEKEVENLVFRRSIYVVKDIKKGEIISSDNIRVIRPGYGLHPKYYEDLMGKKSKKELKRGTPFKKEYVDSL